MGSKCLKIKGVPTVSLSDLMKWGGEFWVWGMVTVRNHRGILADQPMAASILYENRHCYRKALESMDCATEIRVRGQCSRMLPKIAVIGSFWGSFVDLLARNRHERTSGSSKAELIKPKNEIFNETDLSHEPNSSFPF